MYIRSVIQYARAGAGIIFIARADEGPMGKAVARARMRYSSGTMGSLHLRFLYIWIPLDHGADAYTIFVYLYSISPDHYRITPKPHRPITSTRALL